MNLSGRNAIITGASQGLGYAIAQAYLDAGANVVICARDAKKLLAARDRLAAHCGDERRVVEQVCDVSDPMQVSALVKVALDAFDTIHVLVNNAGVYGPMGSLEDVDWREWTKAIEINLYGTLLPIRALMVHFKANGYGRIVNLSGGGATSPLPNISAYAASKAAVVRMTETLAGEVAQHGITVNAVAPGALNTSLQDQLLEAGPGVVGEKLYEKIKQVRDGSAGAPLEMGAALCVFLGSDASAGITGKLISAVWDDWRDLPNHLEELGGDVYTLRRIIPKDRGYSWGEVD